MNQETNPFAKFGFNNQDPSKPTFDPNTFESSKSDYRPLEGSAFDLREKKKAAKLAAQNPTGSPFANDPSKAADHERFVKYKKAYDQTSVIDDTESGKNFRTALQPIVGNDYVAQEDFVKNVVSRAEDIARKNRKGAVDDDIFDAALQELKIDGLPKDVKGALKNRAIERYDNANALYQMRRKAGIIQDSKPNTKGTKNTNGESKEVNNTSLLDQVSNYAAGAMNAIVPASRQAQAPIPNQKQTPVKNPAKQAQQKQKNQEQQNKLIDPIYQKDQRRLLADKYGVDISAVPESPFGKPIEYDYAMFDGTVAKGAVVPSVFDTPETIAETKRKQITKSQFHHAYGAKTALPIGVQYAPGADEDTETPPEYLTIGDVNKADKDLQLEFITKFSGALINRAKQTGKPELTLAQAKAIANQLVPMMNQSQDEGLLDYIVNVADRPGKWRNGLFQLFGVDDEFESIVGEDEVLRDLYNDYKGKINDIQNLKGAKAQYNSKIPLKMFDTTNNPLDGKNRISAEVSFLKGGVGWVHSSVSTFLERLENEAIKENYNINKDPNVKAGDDIKMDLGKVLSTGVANAGTLEELRTMVLQDPNLRGATGITEESPVNTIMSALAGLYGNLKAGPLRIGGATSRGAAKLVQIGGQRISNTEKFAKAAELVKNQKVIQAVSSNKTVQNFAKFLSKNPELGDGVSTAATFLIADLVESMPTATNEQLIDAATKGMLFGVAGTAMAERVVFPFMMRNNAYQKLLADPTFAAEVDAAADGVGAARLLLSKVSQQKEVAYALGNALANPFQDYVAASLEGQDYDAAQFAISLLSGGMMGLEFARRRGKLKKENPEQFEMTPDDYVAAAAAEQARKQREDAETEAKRSTGNDPAEQTPDNDVPSPSGNAPDKPQTEEAKAGYENTNIDEDPNIDRSEPNLDEIEANLYEEVQRQTQPVDKQPTIETKSIQEDQIVETTWGTRKAEIANFDLQLSDNQKTVLNVIEPMIAENKVVYHNSPNGKLAEFDPETGTIYIDNSIKDTDIEVNALIHEATHAASRNLINNDSQFRAQVEALRRKTLNSRFFQKWAKEHPNQAAYMADDLDEFFVGFVDNKFGVADVIDKHTKSTGQRLVDLTGKLFGTSDATSKETLTDFRNLVKQIPETKVPEPTLDESATLIIPDLADIQPVQQSLFNDGEEPQSGTRQGMFKDFQSVLELRRIRNTQEMDEAVRTGALFIAEMDKLGIRDEVGLAFMVERMTQDNPHWLDLNPLQKAKEMLAYVQADDGGITAAELKQLREESDKTATQDEITSYEWLQSPTLDKRVLATLLGAEKVSMLEATLNRGMADPNKLVSEFPNKVTEALTEMGANDEQMEIADTKARQFIRNYVFSHSNIQEITPLGIQYYLDAHGREGTPYISDYSELKRDPVSQATLQTSVQNPTGMLRRMDNVKNEVLTYDGSTPSENNLMPHLSWDVHMPIANALSLPRIGNVTNSKRLQEAKLFNNAADVGRVLINTGWFYLPKGPNGNIFFDLGAKADLLKPVRHSSPSIARQHLVDITRSIEEMNIGHFLTSERLWGVGSNRDVDYALRAIPLWDMVRMAMDGSVGISEQANLKDYLRKEIADNPKRLQKAEQKKAEIIASVQETVKRLAKYYEKNQLGERPEILHQVAEQSNDEMAGAALATAINHYYHKIFDHGNVNDLIQDPASKKYMKLQAKYMGVQTQFAYKKLKDVSIANALLQSKNSVHLPIDISKLSDDDAQASIAYWRNKGILIDKEGNVKLKQFIMSDEWAEANPEIWARLSGQEPIQPSAKVTLTGKTAYVNKDQNKANLATKFIGRGSDRSSTARYAADFGELANTGKYNKEDRVFISAEGNRAGRVPVDFNEIDLAMFSGATLITDDINSRNRDYNVGEREVADYLTSNNYVEVEPGIWRPILDEQVPTRKLIPPSKYYDGASLMINKGTHDVLAEINNEDPENIGAIKYGYGGDFIYKSDFTPMYETGDEIVDSWLQSLRDQNISNIAVQSAIKSKSRIYKRSVVEPGVVAVHDDDGTLVGIEKDGKYTPTSKEDNLSRYTNAAVPAELVKDYDLVGQNAIGIANMARVNTDFSSGMTFGLDRTPYAVFADDVSRAFENTFQRLQYNKIDKFYGVYGAYKKLVTQQGIVADKDLARFVRSMVDNVRAMDENDSTWGDYETQQKVLRILENALLDGNRVNVSAIQMLDHIYPQIMRGDANVKPIARRVLSNAYEQAVKTACTGKSYRLAPYVPKANHATNGLEVSKRWKAQEIREALEARNASEAEIELAIQEGLAKYEQEAAAIVAEHLPNNKLVDYGVGYIQSVNEINAYNEHVRKRRSAGEKLPYLYVGSKTIGKLTPSDALTSWSSRILVGADSDMNAGMMMNQPFAINSVGRDHDGDGFIMLYEDDDWSNEPKNSPSEFIQRTSGNQFQKFWQLLADQGTNVTDPFKDLSDKIDNLKTIDGRPFNRKIIDMRVNKIDGIRKTLDANSALGEDIGTGISTLNNYYEKLRQIGRNSGKPTDFIASTLDYKIVFKTNSDYDKNKASRLKINDAYFKQAQYDRFNGLPFDSHEVFMRSRIHHVDVVEGDDLLKQAAELYNQEGIVRPILWDVFTSAITPVKANTDTYLQKTTKKLIAGGQTGRLFRRVDLNPDAQTQFQTAIGDVLADVLPVDPLPRIEAFGDEQRAYSNTVRNNVDKLMKPFETSNAKMANFDPFREIRPDADTWVNWEADTPSIDPTQAINIKEMLSRCWSAENTIIDITPDVSWELASDGVYLRTPEERIPIGETINHKGEFHNEVARLIAEEGLALSEIYNRDIIGHVSMADIRLSMPTEKLKTYLQSNPDVTVVRVSGMKNVYKDASVKDNLVDVDKSGTSYIPNKDYPNFFQVSSFNKTDKDIALEIGRIIRAEIRKGNRVVIDRESLGTAQDPITLPTTLLDINRKVRVDRSYNDQQRARLRGRFYGAVDPNDGYAYATAHQYQNLPAGYLETNSVLYNIHRGLKDIGANTITPSGNDVIDDIIYTHVKNSIMHQEQPHKMELGVPASQTSARRLGMFDGSIGKIRGTSLGEAKAGPLNRLNKYAGRDVLTLTHEDSETIINAVTDYVRNEFPDAPDIDAVIDAITHTFNPMALKDLETGRLDEVRRNHGELAYKTAKNYAFVQALSKIADVVKQQKRGKIGRLWDLYGWTAKQSTEDMVRLFANDKKIYNGATPVYEMTDVSLTPNGPIVRTAESKLYQQFEEDNPNKPKYAALESGTAIRHSFRYKQLNGIKDAMAQAAAKWRDETQRIFPEGSLFTTAGADEAMAILKGQDNPFYKDVAEAYIDVEDTGNGPIEVARQRIVRQQADRPVAPVFGVELQHNGIPTVTATFTMPDGSTRLFMTSIEENGFFSLNDLTDMAKALMPDESYIPGGKASRLEIEAMLKRGITAKAYNSAIAAYQHSYAATLQAYIDKLRAYNNDVYNEDGTVKQITESAFYDVINQANGLIKELTDEANARYNSSLADNISAMSYVNYDVMAARLTDYLDAFDNSNKEEQTSMLRRLGASADALDIMSEYDLQQEIDADQAGQFVLALLRKRLQHANSKNKQLTKTQAFFERELLNPEERSNSSMYSVIDSKIMQEIFRAPKDFNPDVVFRKNQEVIDGILNKVNAVFRNAYVREKQYRKAAGLDYLEQGIAEDNFLADLANDNHIYNRQIDIHSSKGWRQALHNVHRETGAEFLIGEELGVDLATPMSITFRSDDAHGVRTINGRLAGVVRIKNNVILSKTVKDMVEKNGGDIAELNKLLQTKNNLEESADYKDLVVLYNQDSGALNYIDLGTVTTALTGEVNGRIGRAIQSRRAKQLEQQFAGADGLGRFLTSQAAVQTLKVMQGDNIKTIETLKTGAMPKNIKFFGEIGRNDIPPGVAKAYNAVAATLTSQSSWMHGYGRQAATLAAGIAILPFNQITGGWMIGGAIFDGGTKFLRNYLGNAKSFISRSLITQTTSKLSDLGGYLGKGKQAKQGSAVAASAARRINRGVGLDPEVRAAFKKERQASDNKTAPLQRQLAELQRIKDHFDGLGRYLTDTDFVVIHELIARKTNLRDKVVADIRQGQLSLSLATPEGRHVRSLNDLYDANLNTLNQFLVGAGHLGKASMFLGPEGPLRGYADPTIALAELNNLRLRTWQKQGETEESGIRGASAKAEESFNEANASKMIMDDEVSRVNFVNASVDLLQGKFDQRALHLRTPLGRAISLFSQYSQNFNRYTLREVRKEREFWEAVNATWSDDPDFRKALVTKYGYDIGSMIVQTPLTAFDKQGNVKRNLLGLIPQNKAGLWMATQGLMTAGLSYLLGQFALQQEYVPPAFQSKIEQVVGALQGSESLPTSAIKAITLGIASSLWYDESEAKKEERSIKDAWRDFTWALPGGVGYTPFKEAVSNMGLYLMYLAGILPEYKAPTPLKIAETAAGPISMPVTAVSNVQTDYKKAARFSEDDKPKFK